MFRIDKQLDLTNLIGTSRPSFASVQIFNNWITDYEGSDQLINTAGFGGKTEEFSSILTAVLSTNYANDTVNPSLAGVADLTYGGGVIIPAVELVQGTTSVFVSRGASSSTRPTRTARWKTLTTPTCSGTSQAMTSSWPA